MIKRILVPTDGSEESQIGVDYGVALAKRLGASVHGVHVIDVKLLEGPFLRDISASLGTAPFVNYQNNIAMILEERGKMALQALEKACEAAEVSYDTTLATGIVAKTIIEHGDLADLIVIGRSGEHTDWLEGLVGSTTEAVTRGAATPVMVTGNPTPEFERFVAAYDGSHHAKRALQVCADVAVSWKIPVHVLAIDDDSAQDWLNEAKSYLDPHDVQAEYVVRNGDPSEEIVRYAQEIEADLIVMGAYGHTKVRELVLGSTTSYTLNHAPCPVLLAR